MVTFKQRKERGLRAGRTFHAAESELADSVFEFFEVEHQIVAPQGRSLANGCWLSRLQMCEAEAGQVAIFGGEFS